MAGRFSNQKQRGTAMKQAYALTQATNIANLLLEGSEKLKRTAVGDLPLLATLPLLTMPGRHLLPTQWDPSILEILVFGSVAVNFGEVEAEVGDIDMMILDRGFYSPIFQGRIERAASRHTDWYQSLDNNLRELLLGWFGLDAADETVIKALVEPVDLHILPTDMLLDHVLRQKIAEHHRDREFLQNAFSSVLRFNPIARSFERTTPEDLTVCARWDKRHNLCLMDQTTLR